MASRKLRTRDCTKASVWSPLRPVFLACVHAQTARQPRRTTLPFPHRVLGREHGSSPPAECSTANSKTTAERGMGPCSSCSQTRPTPETVKVSFTGENESWIAGTAARMFHTTDGATWDIQAHPRRQPMLRVRYEPSEESCVRPPTWRPIRLFALSCRARRRVSGSGGVPASCVDENPPYSRAAHINKSAPVRSFGVGLVVEGPIVVEPVNPRRIPDGKGLLQFV